MSISLLNDAIDAIKDNVQVFLKIFKVDEKVLVNGNAKAEVSLLCSRCLRELSYPVNVKFEVEYLPFREFTKVNEYELTREELDINFYKNDQIDIEELVREQVLLAIPMKPLCKSDCQGMCPKCGKDLNEGQCECKTEGIDPRLASLKKFKESL